MSKINRENRNSNTDLWIVSFLIILSALLRLPNYTKLSLMPDELIYSDYAYSIIAFGWGWPPDQMYAQPPLFPYLLSILTYLFWGGLEVFRLVPIFFGVLDVVVLYFLGKAIYNRWVGLLSALFLAFSSYHILYSRTLMLETMLIFFILAALYFIWRAYSENRLLYAAIAGIFIGLGNDTKYSAFLLYPILICYLLWINRKGFRLGWRSLIEKKHLVIIIVSFLVFSPVLIDLILYGVNPLYWQLFERYKLQFAGYKSVSQFGIPDLILHGYNNYVGLLIDATPDITNGFKISSGSIATMSIPWLFLFEFVAYILLPLTILYYLYHSLHTKPRESFILIAFLAFNAFAALFGTRFQYYLLWNAPLFFIMLSNMTFNFAKNIKSIVPSNAIYFKNSMKIIVLIMVGLFLLSYVYIGVLSPFVNESIKVGYEKQISKIKEDIDTNDSIATDKMDMLYYYFNKYDMKFVAVVPLYEPEKKIEKIHLKVNLDLLDTIKPKYIIVAVYSFSSYATSYDKTMILEKYNLISDENDMLLYKRKSD